MGHPRSKERKRRNRRGYKFDDVASNHGFDIKSPPHRHAEADVVHSDRDVIDISVVMPCLNEEDSVGICIAMAWEGIHQTGLRGEVIVSDNGSTYASVAIAEAAGARVVHQPKRGYGNAYLKGFEAARGRHDRHGRLGRLVRLRRPPRARRATRAGWVRLRPGVPARGRDREGRHALVAPLHRQPGADHRPQHPLQAWRSPTPTAGCESSPDRRSTVWASSARAWSSPPRSS